MRRALDIILRTLNIATLADAEYAVCEPILGPTPTLLNQYQALYVVISERGGVGNDTLKLDEYFSARGVDTKGQPKKNYNNVFIGAVLE